MAEDGIRELAAEDARELAGILAAQRPEYLAHFHPFAFDADTLVRIVGQAARDRYWGIHHGGKLVGFCMLRGIDLGFARPSFGVFIAEDASGRGLARRLLAHALDWCATHGFDKVLIKVAPQNHGARKIYVEAGFISIGACPTTGQEMLETHLLSGKHVS